MNKAALVRTLQFILLIFTLLSQLTSASASAMNTTQYSSSPIISPSATSINNSLFTASPAIEIIAGTANSSQYSICIGLACTLSICGNNILESGEACDGTELAGATCTSRGFSQGTLRCNNDCSGFDTSSCTTPEQPQQPSGPSGGQPSAGGGAESTTTTTSTTSSTTTTTTIQLPEEEKPSVIDKAKEAVEKTIHALDKIEKQSRTIYLATLSLALALALYTLYLFTIFITSKLKQHKEEKAKAASVISKSSQENARRKLVLKHYIKSNMEKGYSLSHLASILIQHNWPKEEVGEAIKEVLEELRK